MQQRQRGFVGHPSVAIGGAGDHALEQPKNCAHARFTVYRGNQLHFRCAGVGKADLHVGVGEGAYQCIGSIHALFSIV